MSVLPDQPLLGVITVETGIEHLYLQQGHPAYLLSKLAVEICVYIHTCETH